MPEHPATPPVTFAELHAEIARRDQRIGELTTALTALVITVGRHPTSMSMAQAEALSRAVHEATTVLSRRPGIDALDRWDPSIPPGGYVCSVCGDPTESEPCPAHQPRAYAAIDQPEPARPDMRAALAAVVAWWDAGDEPGAVRIAPRAMWDNARTALGWPQPDPALDPADLRITFYDPPDANGFDAAGWGVSILHVPSGWGTSCHSERSQLQNKAQALRALRARVAVWRNTE